MGGRAQLKSSVTKSLPSGPRPRLEDPQIKEDFSLPEEKPESSRFLQVLEELLEVFDEVSMQNVRERNAELLFRRLEEMYVTEMVKWKHLSDELSKLHEEIIDRSEEEIGLLRHIVGSREAILSANHRGSARGEILITQPNSSTIGDMDCPNVSGNNVYDSTTTKTMSL